MGSFEKLVELILTLKYMHLLSGIIRRTCDIVGLLCSLIQIETGRPTVKMGHLVKEENR
jgi:hypothetical protein